MASLADLVVTISAQTKEFDKAINNVKKQTTAMETGFKSATGAIKNLVSGVVVTALVAKIADVTAELINSASEAEETQAKFETAFRGIENTAEQTALSLADAYGLSSTKSKQLLGNTGDLLKGFGATATEALNFSKEIQKLAVDLASYNNVQGGASRVSNILTKSVLGNKDGLSELGVSLLDVDIKQELVRTGQDKLTGQAGKLAKAQATFNLILQQTADAQGDAIRTQESYANVSRRAEAASQDLRVELGRALLPTATTVKSIFGDLVGELATYIRRINDIRDAEKALEAGQATFEQRVLLLEEQKKGIDETLKTQRAFAEAEKRQYGEVSPLVQQRLRQLEAQSAGIGRQIDQIRVQAKEEENLKQVEADREAEKERQRRAEEEAERQRQINHKAALEAIDAIIQANKTDLEVVEEQIKALANLAIEDKETHEKRLESIAILTEKKKHLVKEEKQAEKEKADAIVQNEKEALEKIEELKQAERDKDKELIRQSVEDRKEANEKVLGQMSAVSSQIDSIFSDTENLSTKTASSILNTIADVTGSVEVKAVAIGLGLIGSIADTIEAEGAESIGEAFGAIIADVVADLATLMKNNLNPKFWFEVLKGFGEGFVETIVDTFSGGDAISNIIEDFMAEAGESSGVAFSTKIEESLNESLSNLAERIAEAQEKISDAIIETTNDANKIRLDNEKELQRQLFDENIKRIENQESFALQTFLDTLSDKEIAALKSEGVLAETSLERINREIQEAREAGDTELQSTLENEKAIVEIRENARAQELAEQERYQAEVRRINREQAVFERDLAVSQAEVNKIVALTNVPPGTEAFSQLSGAYDSLISQLQATPLPQLATGAVVRGSARGTAVTVAENNQPELILGGGAEGEPLIQQFADKVVAGMGGGSMPIVINFNSGISFGNKSEIETNVRRIYPAIIQEQKRRGIV